jgi:signal recognition particle receptor subunit beta
MFDPRSIRRGVEQAPRKIVVYGPPKIGKSTFVSAAPNSLLIPTEDRVKHIDCAKTEVVESFSEIMDIFTFLCKKSQHSYQSVIIDTLDWMEPMIHKYVCDNKGFTSLHNDKDANVNYGRGLKVHAVEGWKVFLQNCDVLRQEADMNIILVAHSMTEKISPPDTDAYDRYTMKLDKNAVALVEEWADVIGFYNREVVVKKEDAGFSKKVGKALNIDAARTLNLQATTPSWISGNSFGLRDFDLSDPSDAEEAMKVLLGLDLLEKKEPHKKLKKEMTNEQ